MTNQVTVRKLDARGAEVFHYSGNILRQSETSVVLETIFDMDKHEFHGLVFSCGDRFIETHFCDRWYNVLAIYDVNSGIHKGWYCNITRPAKIEGGTVSAEDLALDLVVLPDGTQFVLDEEEFTALDLSSADRASARTALQELKQYAEALDGPFKMEAWI